MSNKNKNVDKLLEWIKAIDFKGAKGLSQIKWIMIQEKLQDLLMELPKHCGFCFRSILKDGDCNNCEANDICNNDFEKAKEAIEEAIKRVGKVVNEIEFLEEGEDE